jgi:ABC-2 type transport system ATP-binding protein
MKENIMLEIKNIVKTFGSSVRAVDDISLSLKSGVVGLIGHNGAGKTTLMQMMATLIKPTSGTMIFQGVDIVKSPNAMRDRLGFLPQDFGVYPNLSAFELMQYFAGLKGVRDPERIRYLLELVNLTEHAHRSAASFSGGMRRRLGIAQALLNDPDILIVDEPTAGLDPEERLRFRNLLADLGGNKLVIISTHIVSDVESIASELAIMRKGKLIDFATPDSFIERAYGNIWTAKVNADEYQYLRTQVNILQTQRQGDVHIIRMSHPTIPCVGAQLVQPNLEEALMSEHYASVDGQL